MAVQSNTFDFCVLKAFSLTRHCLVIIVPWRQQWHLNSTHDKQSHQNSNSQYTRHGMCILSSNYYELTVFDQFEGAISEASQGIVHHLEVFHCEVPVGQKVRPYNAPCKSMAERPAGLESCRKVIGAWAMGASVSRRPAFHESWHQHTHV